VSRFWSNVLAIAWKEAQLMRHDPALVSTILIQPVIMCLLFGGALSNEPKHVPWLVLDRSETAVSRRLVADLHATGNFEAPRRVASYDEAVTRMRRGDALALLVVPDDFARDAGTGRGNVQLLLDGSDPIAAARVGSIVATTAREFRTDGRDLRSGGLVTVRQRFWFNATLADSSFYLSALSVILLTNLCLSASCLGLVGERESGTYEQMLALPTTSLEIVLGKLVPHVVACYFVLTFSTVLAGGIFGYWPRGSFLTLAFVALPFILASLSIGVFVSTLAHTSAQAVFISVFFIMPSFVLSGLMMPYEFMPHPVRELGGLLPSRWFQIAARRIVARGAGFGDVLVPWAILWTIFFAMLGLTRWRMKPRLG
jgi:ABC-2 type transport system permease protein